MSKGLQIFLVRLSDQTCLGEKAILAPKNEIVNSNNAKPLDKLSGKCKSYKSVVKMGDPDKIVRYPIQFLNGQQP